LAFGAFPLNRPAAAPPDEEKLYNSSGLDRYCLKRHGYTINVCFVDGSVRTVRLKTLWDLRWHKEYTLDVPLPDWPEWMVGLPE